MSPLCDAAAIPVRDGIAPPRSLYWACLGCAGLLMLSGFKAPLDYPWLEPFFVNFKVGVRLVTILTLALALGLAWHHQPERTLRAAVLLFPLGLFCVYALISTCWSALKPETLGQAGSLTTLVLLAFAASLLVQSEHELSQLMAGLSLLGIAICLLLFLTGILLPQTGHMSRDGEGLGHSTNCGATASLGMLLLILPAMLWSWRWPRLLLVPGVLILSAVMLIANNRLSMAITFLLFGVAVCRFGNRTLMGSLSLSVGTLGTLFLMLDPGFDSIQSSVDYLNRDQSSEELGSFSGRNFMWEAMWDSYLQSPWIGHGYFVTSATGTLYVWYAERNFTAHNLILQVLVTTGIVGTVLFFLGLGIPAVVFAAVTYGRKSVEPLKWFLGILFVWYFLWGLLNESFMGPVQPESVIFFVLFGIMIGVAAAKATNDPFESSHSLPQKRTRSRVFGGSL